MNNETALQQLVDQLADLEAKKGKLIFKEPPKQLASDRVVKSIKDLKDLIKSGR